MDNSTLIRTALSDADPVSSAHMLAEAPLGGKLNLRGNPDDPAFRQAIEDTLELALPIQANTTVSDAERQLFWLGPDEWLISLPLDQLEDTRERLSQVLIDMHHALIEISDYYTVLELRGPQAREVIQSASPLDIRPENFGPGQCAQTRFGHASILLWPIDDTPAFGIQVRWSYAQYLYDYLAGSIRNAEALDRSA